MLRSSRVYRRLVLAAIVAAVAVPCLGVAVVQFRADESWRAMLAAQSELQAAWNAQPKHRAVAWGEGTEGLAFVHYERALALAVQFDTKGDSLCNSPRLGDDSYGLDRDAEFESWQPMLAELRAGAHALDATPLPRTNPSEACVPLLHCRWLFNAAVTEARALRHRGQPLEAVRRTLDAATFGADLMRRGLSINQLVGAATLGAATMAWSDAALAMLDRAALDELATGLERLDRELPESLDQTGELLFLANALQRPASDPNAWPTPSAWRFGMSTRWMVADAFLRTAGAARELACSGACPWPQRAAILDMETAGLAESNPMFEVCSPLMRTFEQTRRDAIARLRLLRMAVDRHRGLDVPPLRDPLGDGPIVVTKTDSGVHLHCASADDQRSLARDVSR